MDDLQFVSWNLDYWRKNTQKRAPQDLLTERGRAVIALQEVHSDRAKALKALYPVSVFSQELHPHANWSWSGCALLLPSDANILGAGLISGLPKPQRGVWATVQLLGHEPLTVVSWHTPNAAGDGIAVKSAAYQVMSAWLHVQARPVILGVDLNTWRDPVDLVPPADGELHFDEHEFVGPNPSHGLMDPYRTLLAADGTLDRLRHDRPDGPLAVSHVLPGGAAHRMDRIFASPGLVPKQGGYLYEEAVKCGSDHALVWIQFSEDRLVRRGACSSVKDLVRFGRHAAPPHVHSP